VQEKLSRDGWRRRPRVSKFRKVPARAVERQLDLEGPSFRAFARRSLGRSFMIRAGFGVAALVVVVVTLALKVPGALASHHDASVPFSAVVTSGSCAGLSMTVAANGHVQRVRPAPAVNQIDVQVGQSFEMIVSGNCADRVRFSPTGPDLFSLADLVRPTTIPSGERHTATEVIRLGTESVGVLLKSQPCAPQGTCLDGPPIATMTISSRPAG
jgi:hypothetical protein